MMFLTTEDPVSPFLYKGILHHFYSLLRFAVFVNK